LSKARVEEKKAKKGISALEKVERDFEK